MAITCLSSPSLEAGVSSTSSTISVVCRQPDSCAACQKVVEMDVRADDLRRQLEEVLAQRQALVSIANSHHDLLLRRLPVEVVMNIFLECRPIIPAVHSSQKQYNAQTFAREVFKLSHVCTSWRRLALSSPQLWTILAVTVTRRNCERMRPLVHQWIERSGQLPLFVQVTLGLKFADADPKSEEHNHVLSNAHRLLASIIDHAERWQAIDITIPSTISSWMSAALSHKTMNRVDLLKVRVVQTNAHDQCIQLDVSPTIWNSRDNSFGLTSGVGFSRLTHFITDLTDLGDIVEVLRGAPHLSYLRVDGLDDQLLSEEPVLAPNLRVLIVTDFLGRYFHILTLPALQTLHITDSFNDREEDQHDATLVWWRPVASMIKRSGCKLKELKIQDSTHDGYATGKFLAFTPDLQRLILNGVMLSNDEFFSGLCISVATTDSAPRPFLRQLKSLHCVAPCITLDLDPMVAFLEELASRSDSSLQEFKIRYTVDLRDDLENVKLSGAMFARLMDVARTRRVEVCIVNREGQNLVNRLRILHV